MHVAQFLQQPGLRKALDGHLRHVDGKAASLLRPAAGRNDNFLRRGKRQNVIRGFNFAPYLVADGVPERRFDAGPKYNHAEAIDRQIGDRRGKIPQIGDFFLNDLAQHPGLSAEPLTSQPERVNLRGRAAP